MKKIFLGINTFMFTFMCLFTIGVKAEAIDDFKGCLSDESEICTLSDDIESATWILVSKNKTVDLNNHTITFTSGNQLGFVAYTGNITFKNGTIINDSTTNTFAMTIAKSANVILDNMIVKNDKGPSIQFTETKPQEEQAENSKLTINANSTVTCAGGGAAITSFAAHSVNQINVYGKVIHTGSFSAINGGYQAKGLNINVYEGATLEALNEGAAILQMCEGNINIYGGNLIGGSGIAMTEGTLNVEGGTITGKKAYVEHTQNSSKGHIDDNGAAIYLESTGNINATISGGTLISDHSYVISAPNKNGNEKIETLEIKGGEFIANDAEKTPIEPSNATGKTGFVSGGIFSDAIDNELIKGDQSVVSLTSSGETNYYIGTSTTEVAEDAKYGDTIEVLQGDYTATGLPSGVTVKNSGEGEVTVNGVDVSEKGSYTVPTTSSGSSSSSSSNTKDYNVTENVTYTPNGEDIDIKGSIVTETNDTYDAMIKIAQDRGYAKLFNMYEIHEVNNNSLTKSLTLTFNLGEENNGKYAYILHQKHDNTYEKWEQEVVNGKVSISVSELSPFIVALKDKEENKEENKGEVSNPQTSSINVIALGLISTTSLIGLITLVKKNRKNI